MAQDRIIVQDVAKLKRHLALKIARAYRTVSHEAAILVRLASFGIIADRHRRFYLRKRELI